MIGNTSMPDGMTPFILIARKTVKEDKIEEYLNLADQTDKAVEASEPGMLFHNFDADPNDPKKFVWSEIYRYSSDFLFHADNPPVQDYVAKHDELADYFSIEIYGDVSEEVVSKIKLMGVPFQHFKSTRVGYVREERFK